MTLARAIDSGDPAQLPSRRDEDWRWTDLAGQIRTLPPASPQADAGGTGPFDSLAHETVLLVNGRGHGLIELAGRRTVALRIISATAGTAYAAQLILKVGEGAVVTLLESHEGQAAGYLSHTGLIIDIAPDARLERIVLCADAEDAIAVSLAEVTLAPGASFAQTVITDGAKRQRIETRVIHLGGGAEVRMDGAYLISGRRHGDITTVVDHTGRDGTTNQLVKGMVSDQARAVFQGRIVVAHGSDGTDARMRHQALIASDRAEVDAKPELLIFADDVQCAHGNTIGTLDDDALFYIRQRGIPDAQARALLATAFVAEVVDRIADDGARDVVAAWVAAHFETA